MTTPADTAPSRRNPSRPPSDERPRSRSRSRGPSERRHHPQSHHYPSSSSSKRLPNHRPEEELFFDMPPPRSSTHRIPPKNPSDRGVRRMSSVPELREVNRRPGFPDGPRSRTRNNSRQDWESGAIGVATSGMPPEGPYNGGQRLVRDKSLERGIVGPPGRPSPQRKRAPSGASERRTPSRAGSRAGSRPGSRGGSGVVPPNSAANRPPPLALRMPLAFNTIARERGFTTGSQPPQPQPPAQHPHTHPRDPNHTKPPPANVFSPKPSSSAPDLYTSNESRQFTPRSHRDLPRSHPLPPHPPFSAAASANSSPHSSFGPPSLTDEVRTSFRSALSGSEVNRSSGFTTSDEAESGDAMTVDEAIGMYASDTEDEHSMDQNRRSKGDSVLGGAVSRQGTWNETGSIRSKGDSVLGGDISPATRSRMNESEIQPSERADTHGVVGSPVASPIAKSYDYQQSPTHVEKLEELVAAENQQRRPQSDPEPELMSATLSSPLEHFPEPIATPLASPELPSAPATESAEQTPPMPKTNAHPPVVTTQPTRKPVPERSNDAPDRELKPAQANPKDARDRYGFRKQTLGVSLKEYEEWEGPYEEALQRRRRKWEQLLRESGLSPGEGGPVRFPPKSNKIKRYVRKGIPPEWRGAAWFWYAGGQRYLNKHPGLYDELVRRGPPSSDAELIERDLHRTFPDNIKFKPDPPPGVTRLSKLQERQMETPLVQALRRVLGAFALHVPRIGYCQSLNFLAGLLLLFMPEEKAFWMLYILTQTHLPGTHEVSLEGSSVDQWVLMMGIREGLPGVWGKIAMGLEGAEVELASTKLPPITLCTSGWFMSGFVGILPWESALRVWDCLFYEGSKTLFRIALTVLKLGEPEIRAVNDPMEIFQVIQNIPRRMIDAGALIEACYRRRNGFGHISQETIDARRVERRGVYAEERAALARGSPRISKDDATLRAARIGPTAVNNHPHVGRRFRKILVKA